MTDAAVTCPACAQVSPATARFCSNCGTPLAMTGSVSATERRRVTIVFADLSDFTGWAEDLDPERVGLVTDKVLAACAAAVVDHGGHVDKLTGDGIMAVFGAPTAHEDDAERAVSAALAMQDAARDMVLETLAVAGGSDSEHPGRLGLRVGMNTGTVLAGVQASLSYTVVGDAVNVAARLSDVAAVGAVLAGRETALATMHMAAWKALPVLTLKGKRETVAAYELTGFRASSATGPSTGAETPLAGRTAELDVLLEQVAASTELRRPVTSILRGEAGSGKTRLLIELARVMADEKSARVLWGRCAPYGVGRELQPVVELVRGVLGLEAEEGESLAAAVRARLANLEAEVTSPLGILAPGMADRLLGLLGAGPHDLPGAGLPGSAARREQPRLAAELDAVAALLRLWAGSRPLVLCLDDLHWASPQLRDALVELARRLSGPVLIAGAGRTAEAELAAGSEWWWALPDVGLLEVGPLDHDAVETLVLAHLGGAPVGEEAMQLLTSRAQGNPFFLEELLHLLIDRGSLRRNEFGTWVLDGDLPAELLPVGVQAVLAARIDALDPPAKAVLRDAAVLGTRVYLTALQELSGGDPGSVVTAAAALVSRRLLQPAPDDRGQGRVFVFAHALARDVAYAAIPKGERAGLHARAATWALEALPEGSEADQVVATHADRALALADEMGLPADAAARTVAAAGFAAYTRLADAAVGRDDHRTASRLLARALDFPGVAAVPADLLPLQVSLAAELVALRRPEEAAQRLEHALSSSSPGVLARSRLVLGEIRRQQGREADATELWVSAFALASEAGLDGVAGEAIRSLGLQDYFAGRLTGAEERFTEALLLARRVGDLRGVGWALQHLAWSRTSRGAFEDADNALIDAAGVFASLEDVGGLSWCAGTEALVRVLQGRLTEGRELIRGLLPAAEELGDRWAVGACLTIGALAAAELGEPESGLEQARQAEAIFRELGDQWGSVLTLAANGIALRALGRFGEAREILELAVLQADATTAPLTGLVAVVALGMVSLDAGELDAAESAAGTAQAVLERIELSPGAWTAVTVLRGQVLRARGDLAGAEELLVEAARTQDRDAVLFPQRQAFAHLAGVRLERGDVAGAREAAGQALTSSAEDARSRVLALRVFGSVLRAEGDLRAARQAWHEALAVAQASQLRHEAAVTERLLD